MTTDPGEGGGATEQGQPEVVGLTWHNPNTLVLVEGPEIAIQP